MRLTLLLLAAACNLTGNEYVPVTFGPRFTPPDAAAASEPPPLCASAVLGQPCVEYDSFFRCEKKSSPVLGCNEQLRCKSYSWTMAAEPETNCATTCPANAPDGGCEGSALCEYPLDGKTCGCAGDGGVWTCVTAEKGCPAVRPAVGSECVESITCDYGGCQLGRAINMACEGGYWVVRGSCP